MLNGRMSQNLWEMMDSQKSGTLSLCYCMRVSWLEACTCTYTYTCTCTCMLGCRPALHAHLCTAPHAVLGMCRGSLLPDPRYDAVKAIIMAVMDDDEDVPDGRFTARVLLCDGGEGPLGLGMPLTQVPDADPSPSPGLDIGAEIARATQSHLSAQCQQAPAF